MKYYKITLGNVGNTLKYPENYQEEIGDKAIDHLYWDENGVDYLILCIPAEKSAGIIRDKVEEIKEEEAKKISNLAEKSVYTTDDPSRIQHIGLKMQLITLKKQLGQELTPEEKLGLTQEEQDALNPNHPTPGFSKTKTFADRIDLRK